MPRTQRSNPKAKHTAIRLRKELTPAEGKLWSRVRNDQLGVTFRRQHSIGNYIVDFSPEGDDVRSAQEANHRIRWQSAPGTGRI